MPIDPSIALQNVVPQNQIDPLERMNSAQELQSRMNQNRLFQQSMLAKKKFGAILANTPDPETALKTAMQDPDVAAFAPELLSNQAGLTNALASLHGMEQTQASGAMDAFVKMLPMSVQDPTKLSDAQSAAIAAMPDGPAKQSAMAGMTSLRKGLLAGISDPSSPAGLAKYQQNMAGLLTSYGANVQNVIQSDNSHETGIVIGPKFFGLTNGGAAYAAAGPPNPAEHGNPGSTPDFPEAMSLGGPPAAGSPGTPVRSMGTVEAAQTGGAADIAVGTQKQLAEAATSLPRSYTQLGALEKLMQLTKLGGGAGKAADVAETLQGIKRLGIPIKDSVINAVAGGDLGALQAFQSEAGNLAVGFLRQNQGTWQPTASELNQTLSNQDVNKDPNAVLHLLDLARQGFDITADQVDANRQFQQQRKNDPTFAKEWGPGDFSNFYLNKFRQSGKASAQPEATIQGSAAASASSNGFPEGTHLKGPGGKTFVVKNGKPVPVGD